MFWLDQQLTEISLHSSCSTAGLLIQASVPLLKQSLVSSFRTLRTGSPAKKQGRWDQFLSFCTFQKCASVQIFDLAEWNIINLCKIGSAYFIYTVILWNLTSQDLLLHWVYSVIFLWIFLKTHIILRWTCAHIEVAFNHGVWTTVSSILWILSWVLDIIITITSKTFKLAMILSNKKNSQLK